MLYFIITLSFFLSLSKVNSSSNAPIPVGLIAGLCSAGFVAILVIVFLIFFYRREKKKREQFEMTTILIEPPDFNALAFQTYSIAPSPFGESSAKKVLFLFSLFFSFLFFFSLFFSFFFFFNVLQSLFFCFLFSGYLNKRWASLLIFKYNNKPSTQIFQIHKTGAW